MPGVGVGSSSSPSEGVKLVSQLPGATEGFWPAEGPLPTSPPSKLKFFGLVPYSSYPQYELTFCPGLWSQCSPHLENPSHSPSRQLILLPG